MTKRMAISMPDELYREMVLRIEKKGFATVSEYIGELIKKDEHVDRIAERGLDHVTIEEALEPVLPLVPRSGIHRPGYITRAGSSYGSGLDR